MGCVRVQTKKWLVALPFSHGCGGSGKWSWAIFLLKAQITGSMLLGGWRIGYSEAFRKFPPAGPSGWGRGGKAGPSKGGQALGCAPAAAEGGGLAKPSNYPRKRKSPQICGARTFVLRFVEGPGHLICVGQYEILLISEGPGLA